jgi:phosphatidylglycerol:prolipoprotein diacylglycerol transferase
MFYGGAGAGTLAYAWLASRFGIPAGNALDLALPGFPIAHAIGRIGCLLGGCCYGAPSARAWAIVYTHPLAPAAVSAVPRHPWPLYEALALLALACAFARPPRIAAPAGVRAARYVLLYAAVRCSLEPLRGDAVRGVFLDGLVSAGQLCALATALIALGFLLRRPQAGQPTICSGREAV